MAPINPDEGLLVYVVRDDDNGIYSFEVRPNGVPVVFASRKVGGIDSDLVRAEEEAAKAPPVVSESAPPPGPDEVPPPPPTPPVVNP